MARRCMITGKGVMSGNNVSHAVNKTRRRFLPNLQSTRLMSDLLQERIRISLCTHGLRSVEARGGLDAYLLSMPDRRLTADAKRLKRRIQRKQAATA